MQEFEIENGDKVEKVHVALLFKNNGSWVQLCKATENTISVNAETEDYDFITDKTPTTLVKKYKPSFNNPLTMFKGEPDYDYFFNLFYNLPTGAQANNEVLVVFMNEKIGTHQYMAWRSNVTFVLDNLDPVNSQLTCTTQFNGTIDKGTCTITNGVPTFVGGDVEEFTLTITVTNGDADTKVSINGVTKNCTTDGKASFNVKDGEKLVLGAYDGEDEYTEIFDADADTTTKSITLV